jgi:hypothetical protein
MKTTNRFGYDPIGAALEVLAIERGMDDAA